MTRRRASRAPELVLTCEHADRRIPREYTGLFADADGVLDSHRGWDPGALRLAQFLAKRFDRPLLATRWSRLLVESNRSPTNPRIWSEFTKALTRDERARILDRYWHPHRQEVETAIAGAIAEHGSVVHVAVHSFSPVLDGEVRTADVALLYDSKRAPEVRLARRWQAVLREQAPELRVRLNYPYRGCTDGLATWLRRRHQASSYSGFELEINQGSALGSGWRRLGETLAASLAAAMDPSADTIARHG